MYKLCADETELKNNCNEYYYYNYYSTITIVQL